MTRWLVALFAFATIGLTADSADAQRRAKRVQPTPYDQGKVSIGLAGGFNGTQGSIGGSVGYFVIKGLELAAEGAVLVQGETTIGILGPAARYIVWQVPTIHPYVGTFYRHWFIADIEDKDSVGGRVGIITSQDPFYVSAGVVYERFLFCDDATCAYVTPELSLGISF